jgi:hypothetical protein
VLNGRNSDNYSAQRLQTVCSNGHKVFAAMTTRVRNDYTVFNTQCAFCGISERYDVPDSIFGIFIQFPIDYWKKILQRSVVICPKRKLNSVPAGKPFFTFP